MAYIYARKNGRIEIREAHTTAAGPRSRTLASFRGPLTEALLEKAEGAALRDFDREALLEKARARGIALEVASANREARALLGELRRGARLDPVLAGALRSALRSAPSAPPPEDLMDVIEWLGATDHERGRSLRGVLRLYDRIQHSRDPVREVERETYPRFQVKPARQAS